VALLGNQNIIKFTHHRSDFWANRQSSSMGEISTNYRMTVTPVRSDSIIIIDYILPSQRVTMHALNFHNIYNVTDSNFPNEPYNSGQSRTRTHCPSRGQYNADNAVTHHMRASLASWGTTAKTFTVYSMSYGNDLTRHNHSAGASNTTVHWNSHMFAYAYELEDI
tara:strand:- start:417 stop:911 length:495 start_codon:yes stop_codon:yes gene_type:complete